MTRHPIILKGVLPMELRVLRYFLVVAREENITRAAEMLHITQPTLSRQLTLLEEELGVKLLERGGRRIALTGEGGCCAEGRRNWWRWQTRRSRSCSVRVPSWRDTSASAPGRRRRWLRWPAQLMTPGDVVNIPAGVKHWHGAAADSWFSHLAVEVPGVGGSTEWLEAVDDTRYGAL